MIGLSADETATDGREVARTVQTVGPEQNEADNTGSEGDEMDGTGTDTTRTDRIKTAADFTGSGGTFGNSKFDESMIGGIELADLDLVCLDT